MFHISYKQLCYKSLLMMNTIKCKVKFQKMCIIGWGVPYPIIHTFCYIIIIIIYIYIYIYICTLLHSLAYLPCDVYYCPFHSHMTSSLMTLASAFVNRTPHSYLQTGGNALWRSNATNWHQVARCCHQEHPSLWTMYMFACVFAQQWCTNVDTSTPRPRRTDA